MIRKRSYQLSSIIIALGLAWSVQAQDTAQEDPVAEQQQQALEENQPTDYSNEPFATLLSSEPRFSRFHQALELTGLLEDISELEDATIFAPFDEAFSRLPAGIWEAWEQGDGHDELRSILEQHIIVDQRISREDATDDGQSYTTLAGEDVEVRSLYGALMIGAISVNVPDLETAQGYVHGIDSIAADLTDLQTEPVQVEEPEPEEPEEAQEEGQETEQNGT